jgi:MarR family transcriptional regulator for hemolysin
MDRLRSFGFLLRDVSRLYVRRFEQRAAALGLTLPQCRAVVYLALHEGVSQARLAELTDVEPMTLVRILDRMASDGWLERRVDTADRRARCIYLKAKAKPVVDDIWKLADLTREEAFRGVPKKQAGVLLGLLDQVRNNLATLEPLAHATSAAPPPSARGRRRTGTTRLRRERSTAPS